MRQSTSRHRLGAVAAAVVAIVWASAAVAAPGGGKLCSLARSWVEGHCDGAKASRVATPARCARARDWLDAHCSVRAAGSAERTDPGKARDDRGYKAVRYAPPRRHKHAHKVRTRGVYVYVERPHPCCYSVPLTYYRTTPYKDQVFLTDFVLRPGKEAAFFRAAEASMR
jgi:hypothetical protein